MVPTAAIADINSYCLGQKQAQFITMHGVSIESERYAPLSRWTYRLSVMDGWLAYMS